MPCSCRWQYSGLYLFLQVTLFLTLSSLPCSGRWKYSGWALHVSSGDTILDSVFNAMFRQVKIFWVGSACFFRWHCIGLYLMVYSCSGLLSSMQYSFSWRRQYSGLCLQCHVPFGDIILDFFLCFVGHFCPPGSGSGSAIWMRIRIQQLKLVRIHADPDTDPKPCC